MREQSLQLSTLKLAGSPTTSLKKPFWSRLELRSLFLLVAGIYRGTSLLSTNIQTYATNVNRTFKIENSTLIEKESTISKMISYRTTTFSKYKTISLGAFLPLIQLHQIINLFVQLLLHAVSHRNQNLFFNAAVFFEVGFKGF